MFASHNNQRDHESTSQTVNEPAHIPPHMGSQDPHTFEPDENVIELGLGLGIMDVQNDLDTHELQEVGESEGEEERDNHTFDTADIDGQRGIFEYHSDWGSQDENDGYDSYS